MSLFESPRVAQIWFYKVQLLLNDAVQLLFQILLHHLHHHFIFSYSVFLVWKYTWIYHSIYISIIITISIVIHHANCRSKCQLWPDPCSAWGLPTASTRFEIIILLKIFLSRKHSPLQCFCILTNDFVVENPFLNNHLQINKKTSQEFRNHSQTFSHWPSMSWFDFLNLSGIVNCDTKSLTRSLPIFLSFAFLLATPCLLVHLINCERGHVCLRQICSAQDDAAIKRWFALKSPIELSWTKNMKLFSEWAIHEEDERWDHWFWEH